MEEGNIFPFFLFLLPIALVANLFLTHISIISYAFKVHIPFAFVAALSLFKYTCRTNELK